MLAELISARVKVLLVGPPGCAKTARVNAAARAHNYQVHVLRAALADRIDVGGAIIPDLISGTARELPLESIARLKATDEPTILFLDDLGQAPIDVQAACMRLFDPGYLPENVLIWAATNRPGDKAGVTALCEPLRSRFDVAFHMPMPPQPDMTGKKGTKVESASAPASVPLGTWSDELEAWCQWALARGAAPEIVAWHRATAGRTLYQWTPIADPAARMADYRSWESVIRLHDAKLRSLDIVAAAIGYPAAVEYHAFAALVDKTPSPSQIMADPAGAPIPKDPSALWLVATAVGAAMAPASAGAFCQYIERLPRVYGALAARDAYRRCGAELAQTSAWMQWFLINAELFS